MDSGRKKRIGWKLLLAWTVSFRTRAGKHTQLIRKFPSTSPTRRYGLTSPNNARYSSHSGCALNFFNQNISEKYASMRERERERREKLEWNFVTREWKVVELHMNVVFLWVHVSGTRWGSSNVNENNYIFVTGLMPVYINNVTPKSL